MMSFVESESRIWSKSDLSDLRRMISRYDERQWYCRSAGETVQEVGIDD